MSLRIALRVLGLGAAAAGYLVVLGTVTHAGVTDGLASHVLVHPDLRHPLSYAADPVFRPQAQEPAVVVGPTVPASGPAPVLLAARPAHGPLGRQPGAAPALGAALATGQSGVSVVPAAAAGAGSGGSASAGGGGSAGAGESPGGASGEGTKASPQPPTPASQPTPPLKPDPKPAPKVEPAPNQKLELAPARATFRVVQPADLLSGTSSKPTRDGEQSSEQSDRKEVGGQRSQD